MQYKYFHLHHRLVDASQMLGEFKSFHWNRNVHNVSRCGKLNFLSAPHLIWGIDYQIRGKEFLIVHKNFHGESRKFLFLYFLFEKVLGPMSSKVDVMNKSWLDISMLWSFYNTSWLDIWTFWLSVTLCSMPRGL